MADEAPGAAAAGQAPGGQASLDEPWSGWLLGGRGFFPPESVTVWIEADPRWVDWPGWQAGYVD